MREGGAGEPKERGVKGLEMLAWEERRWWEGEAFLLMSMDADADADAAEDKSSSDCLDLGCERFFFQFRLACRSLSSESSLS